VVDKKRKLRCLQSVSKHLRGFFGASRNQTMTEIESLVLLTDCFLSNVHSIA